MDSSGAALPELDGLRHDAESPPERGQGDLAVLEAVFDLLEFYLEDLTGADNLGLVGYPGANLGFARAGCEIAQRFSGGNFFGVALDDDLPLEGDPWEEQAHVGVGGDMGRLAGLVVGEEGEAFPVEGFEQNRAL